MKSLGEIYWDIDHECLHSDKTISFSDETMMLFHAAEEYVEELRKHDDRWKSIVLHDIDYLKASSIIRREQKGYSEGAEIFLGFIYQELERYGFKIDDDDISSVKETNQPKTIPETEIIPETGENESLNTKKVESLNKAEVMMAVKNEPFGPKKGGKPIQYKEFYKRLTEGKIKRTTGKVEAIEIIDKQYDLELFKYCVDRADISKIFKSRKKCYAIMFMNDIAEYYENPSEYRKAAVKAFHITKLNVGADGKGIRADYRLLMKNLFPDHANYQKKMPKKSK